MLVGHGRVGRHIAAAFIADNEPFVVIESRREALDELKERGVPVMLDNAAAPGVLDTANIRTASRLIIAIPNVYEAGQIIARARESTPKLPIIARAHSDADVRHLEERGATQVIMGERETARRMMEVVRESA